MKSVSRNSLCVITILCMIALIAIAVSTNSGKVDFGKSFLECDYAPTSVARELQVLSYENIKGFDPESEWILKAKNDIIDYSVIEAWIHPMKDNLAGGAWVIPRAQELLSEIPRSGDSGSEFDSVIFSRSVHKSIDSGIYLDIAFSNTDILYLRIRSD